MLFVSRTKLRIGTRVSRQFSLFGSRVLHQICSGSVLSVKIRELRYLIHLLYHISIASCKAFLESPELAVSRFKFVLETISHNTFNEGSSEVFLFLRADAPNLSEISHAGGAKASEFAERRIAKDDVSWHVSS